MASSKSWLLLIFLLVLSPRAAAQDTAIPARPLDAAALEALGIPEPAVPATAPPLPPAQTDAGSWDWTTGVYSYDGSGNITAIGTQKYAYDVRGRLVEANMTRSDHPGRSDSRGRTTASAT